MILRNAKHEAFAQALARGETADAAYVSAGYKENRGNAIRLKTNERVAARVEEIVAAVSEKAEWTAADRLEALKRISTASERGDPRVAVSAIAEANKMQGSHAPTKQEHSGPNGGPIQTEEVTARDRIASRIAGLAARGGANEDTGGTE